ncbi:MAG: hypothetical protein A2X83_05230 [Desulfuromonadales bacterium GWD2_54_10]|nr:MAG: hypothetical protein A2X83_05230 [Desulfuromonadales bacterium GWD2_54_10]
MDTTAIAGASLLAKTSQTQMAMSTSMIKQAAAQQDQMANLLAQNVQNAPQPLKGSIFNFSTYA